MRDFIINRIKEHRPKSIELPEIPDFGNDDSLLSFIEASKTSAATVVHMATGESIEDVIKIHYPNAKRIVNTVSEIKIKSLDPIAVAPRDIHPLDLTIINGEFGVVENGAIWVETQHLPHRVIPFIAEHLIIILSQKDIVGDMHDAYRRLKTSSSSGFGVFIAGPSKTADIEQCLVIGAQGPRSLLVVIW